MKIKKINKRIVIIAIVIILLIFLIFRDNKNYSTDNPKGSKEISESGIYREIYNVYGGGVYGGDVYTVYITDSLTFRKYVGKMFDHEHIAVECFDQENILVLKLDKDKERPKDVIDSTVYNLSD